MYFKLDPHVIYRNYDSFGYLTDNRNFGYRMIDDQKPDIGDKIISKTGSVFVSFLTETPQSTAALVKKIASVFQNVPKEVLEKDMIEFFCTLEQGGFVRSGATFEACRDKNEASENAVAVQSLENTQDFFDGYYKNKRRLTNVHIEITNTCNERCIHCYIPHENKTGSIDDDLFFKILDECKKMNVLHITISGGEPMLHRGLIPFLDKCHELNFSVNLLSNLTLLNDEILEAMKKNKLLSVQTSLYSMDARIHDSITTIKGSFEKTKNSILLLKENGIPVQISCPIMKKNFNTYNDVVKWGKDNGISVGADYVIIAKCNNTCENLCQRITLDDIKNIICENMKNKHYREKIREEIKTNRKRKPDDSICSVCHSSICVSTNGNVYPCAGWQGKVVGNVAKNSLDEIWNNSTKIIELRKICRKDFPQCLICDAQNFCVMCMVRNANENKEGNPFAVNKFFCDVAKIKKSLFYNAEKEHI